MRDGGAIGRRRGETGWPPGDRAVRLHAAPLTG
ncbi:hypothetical protein BPC006_I3658 [Burkholderia pseudomallei BPC006]|nr:hypothetical protein BPC006_I3658 [Burkholderia pseudomallei BPC006]